MRTRVSSAFALVMGAAVALLLAPAVAAADPTVDSQSSAIDAQAEADISGDAKVGIQADWFTGTMAAGTSKSWVWNNAPSEAVYEVSLRPTGATTSASCQFEKTRDWYVQQPGGEREYYFTVKNISSISCGATVYLSGLTAANTGSTAGISPGSSVTRHWNNTNQSHVYKIGVAPTGATSSTACKLEVTRDWYVRSSSTEREYYVTIKNIGSITCAATTLYASKAASSTWSSSVGGNGTAPQTWNNPAAGMVFLSGVNPLTVSCQLELTRSWYVQQILSDGTTKYTLRFDIKNLTASSCASTVQLTWIAA